MEAQIIEDKINGNFKKIEKIEKRKSKKNWEI